MNTDKRIIEHLIIYDNPDFYSSFPNIIITKEDEYLVFFLRAKNRIAEITEFFNAKKEPNPRLHIDPTAQIVLSRSYDLKTWTEPTVILDTGNNISEQDPTVAVLKNGNILCVNFAYLLYSLSDKEKMCHYSRARIDKWHQANPAVKGFDWAPDLQGVKMIHSIDNGKTWKKPVKINHPDPLKSLAIRSNILELPDGSLITAAYGLKTVGESSCVICRSNDQGSSWQVISEIPPNQDPKVNFNENCMYLTEKGKLIIFMRTIGGGGYLYSAFSDNLGENWSQPMKTGAWGHPPSVSKLKNGNVFLVYGHRMKPFGIRAKILNSECENIDEAEEIIIRDDGGSSDIGYPSSQVLSSGNVLVTYYFNKNQGTRFIAGSVLKL